VFRGWDDRVLWSIDYWLIDLMREVLPHFKITNGGLPSWCFDEPFANHSEEDFEKAQEKWGGIIDQMIDGFSAARDILEMDFEKSSHEALKARYEAGLRVFVDNLFDLWS